MLPNPAFTLRQLGNWFNLSTPLGLTIAHLGHCRTEPGPRGLHLASGYPLKFPYADAFAVGNVLIHRRNWGEASPELLAHEEAHSWQWFACAGMPFLGLYGAATAWSWLRTGDRGAANLFEVLAGLERGGYRHLPRRRLSDGLAAAGVVAKSWVQDTLGSKPRRRAERAR